MNIFHAVIHSAIAHPWLYTVWVLVMVEVFRVARNFGCKPSMAPVYKIFAPTDGFAEFIVVVSLGSTIVLAFIGKLTDGFAAALTAIGGLGVIHDNCTAWLAKKLGAQGGQQ